MRNRLIAGGVVIATAALLTLTPVGAEAAKLITGKQIKDSSVTGKDIKNDSLTGADLKESTLGKMPSATHADSATTAGAAGRLAPLASGQTQSGTFGMGSATGTVSGYLGTSINYPRPLAAPIADNHIIDTNANPDAVNCPAPGQASPGYLCLYFDYHSGIDYVYGYSDDTPYSQLPQSIGLGLYAEVTSTTDVYADGVWTVTAP
jgi:hypothetical protein